MTLFLTYFRDMFWHGFWQCFSHVFHCCVNVFACFWHLFAFFRIFHVLQKKIPHMFNFFTLFSPSFFHLFTLSFSQCFPSLCLFSPFFLFSGFLCCFHFSFFFSYTSDIFLLFCFFHLFFFHICFTSFLFSLSTRFFVLTITFSLFVLFCNCFSIRFTFVLFFLFTGVSPRILWEECILPEGKTPQLAEAQGMIALALFAWKKEFRSEYK